MRIHYRYFICCTVVLLLFTAQPPTFAASPYNKARKTFRKANRLARKGSYRKAIQRYQSVLKILGGLDSERAIKGRWEAKFRIAILHIRLSEYRTARSDLERLWSSAPSPADNFHKRLKQQFLKLKGRLLAELVLTVKPKEVKVVVKDSTGPLQPRKSTNVGDKKRLWYDVKSGTIDVRASAVGYQNLQYRIVVPPIRSHRAKLSLSLATGIAYPQAFFDEGERLKSLGNYKEALKKFQRCQRALQGRILNTARGKKLDWQTSLEIGSLLVILKKAKEARTHFRQLWQSSLTRIQKEEFRSRVCRLQRTERWDIPKVEGLEPCAGKKTTKKKPKVKVVTSNMPSALTWALWGGGVVGLVTGGVFFSSANTLREERDVAFKNGSKNASSLDEQYQSRLLAAQIALVGGGLLVVGGVITYLVLDRGRKIKVKNKVANASRNQINTPVKASSYLNAKVFMQDTFR